MKRGNAFIQAANHFALGAGILVLVFNATFVYSYWAAIFGALFAGRLVLEGEVDPLGMLFLMVIVPIGSAWLLGGIIGKRLCRGAVVSKYEAWLRGAIVAAGAGFAMYLTGELGAAVSDYSGEMEPSAFDGHSLSVLVFSYVIPLVALLGAPLGALLRRSGDNQRQDTKPELS